MDLNRHLRREDKPPHLRHLLILGAVIGLHVTVGILLSLAPILPPPNNTPTVISVSVVTEETILSPMLQQPELSEQERVLEDSQQTESILRGASKDDRDPDLAIAIASDIQLESDEGRVPMPIDNDYSETTGSNILITPDPVTDTQADNALQTLSPSRWRLDDNPLSNREETIVALDLDCLNNLEDECQQFRYSLAESELLPSQNTSGFEPYISPKPYDGLSDSRLHGLSREQIKKRLGIPTAGENGLKIPFTNIGIDGPFWDALHGVNKSCMYAVNAEGGTTRTCPE